MKIVHVVSSFGPGGAEILVKDIAIRTAMEAVVEVWAVGRGEDTAFEKRYVEELKFNRAETVIIGKKANRQRLWIFYEMIRLVRERKPDLVIAHSEHATFYLTPAARIFGFKFVQTIHNTVIEFPKLQRYFSRPYIDSYVAISEKCLQLIKRVIGAGEDRIELIYNGINMNRFLKERTVSGEVRSLIAVGRLNVQKDFATMLNAFALLRRLLTDSGQPVPQLKIAGVGPLEGELKAMSENLGISNNVQFLGARNDISELLLQCDIFLMSSRWEGLSIALLEATASGIPIVATDVGSNDEIIRDGFSGDLVPSGNPSEMAKKTFELIIDEDKRKRYSKNAGRNLSRFDIVTCVNNYMHLFYRLMGSNSRTHIRKKMVA